MPAALITGCTGLHGLFKYQENISAHWSPPSTNPAR